MSRAPVRISIARRAGWFLALAFAALSFAAPAQDRKPEYQLGPGDSIRINVFQNPDLTVETRVTENGSISYPLVGMVRIGGLTIPSAEREIARALREGNYLRAPQVSITLLQIRGNQVSVLGAVQKPGRYPLETFDMRISEMLAVAGGIAPTGADTIIVTGTRQGKPVRWEIDVVGMFVENRLERDLVVEGGDVIFVESQPMYYIYGQVQRPGSYRVERGMTVRQALAQGGGLTPRGTERGLRLYRRSGDGKIEVLNPDLNEKVRPNDVVHLQESLF